MKKAAIIFPHQLFEKNPAISNESEIYLVEEFLFFKQFNFHRQKLKFHRATMKFYEDFLNKRKLKVNYIESGDELSDVRKLIPHLIEEGFGEIHFCDIADNWLEKRIKFFGERIKLTEFETPLFINSKQDLEVYFKDRKNFFQTKFYI
jgi:deoxyribodipyrimidine photolyase-related protein